MKLFSISTSLNSQANYFFQKVIHNRFVSSGLIGLRNTETGSESSSLYRRISPLGDPRVSIVPVLDGWIREGNNVDKLQLQRIIKQLKVYRRFKHALEVSQWMTDKRYLSMDSSDFAIRMSLLFNVHGLEQVEKYFETIPEKLKLAARVSLLNCYVSAKSVDKAEATMQKVKEMGYATRPIWYNIMMKLYYELKNWEKLDGLMNELEEKGFPLEREALGMRLCACAAMSDAAGIDKIVSIMQSDSRIVMDWKTYDIAARGYLRVGLVDKALEMLHKLESLMDEMKRKDHAVMPILNIYAEMGKKDQLYRVWDEYKQNNKAINKVYMVMMRALMKVNDVEGVEKVFEEWESSGLSYDFRVPNFLINAYCRDGLLDKAEALVQRGISKGGEPNVVTWCHLAGGYIVKNQVSEAVVALKKAISTDPLYPNRDTLITCVEYLGRKEDMEKFMISLRVKGIPSAAVVDKLYSLIKEDEELSSCAK